MKVAVTGASGHIGNCLVRELLNQGAEVKILVRTYQSHLDHLKLTIIEGDLFNQKALSELCNDADVVFHLAAQIVIDNRSSKKVYNTNITGTKNIVSAAMAAVVKKFIHFSSIDAFKMDAFDHILDENCPIVDTEKLVYDYSKAESERIVTQAVIQGLNAVIISPTAVIGPYDYKGSYLGKALINIYKNKLPFLIDCGYNWVDVRDVVAAAIQSIELGRKGEKYIASGNYCSLKDLSAMIGKKTGYKTPKTVPLSLARLAAPLFEGFAALTANKPLFTSHSLDILEKAPKNISLDKIQQEFGYHPRPLEDTLKDTIEWYKKHNLLD
jgi:dihydroflavonol-4-reductase